MKRVLSICLTFIALQFIFQSSFAINWVGGTGDWNVASNWSPAQVPTASDIAEIQNGTVTIPSGVNAVCRLLHMENSSVSVIVASGATITTGANGCNLQNNATLTIQAGGTFTSNAASSTGIGLRNSGTLINDGIMNLNSATGDVIFMQSGGNITNNGTINASATTSHGLLMENATTSFTNNGNLIVNDRITGAGGSAGTFINNGSLEVNGNINFNTAVFTNASTGTIYQIGDLNTGTGFTNQGTIAAGLPTLGSPTGTINLNGTSPDLSSSTLFVGLESTSGGGVGGNSEYILPAGGITLGASSELEVNLFGGFSPTVGDVFVIAQAPSAVTGTFPTLTVPNCCTWDVLYNTPTTGDISLAVLSTGGAVSTVPTLSEWGLILLGLVVVAMGTVVVWKRRNSSIVN